MKRALDAHVTTLQVLFDLTLHLFKTSNEDVFNELQTKFDELLVDGGNKQFSRTKQIHTEMKTFYAGSISQKFHAFVTEREANSVMFNFFWSYIQLVETLLNFIRASRQGLWLLHLATLEKLCALFFCQNRLKYAQYIPEYLAKMQQLEKTDPSIWQEFMAGNFCVKKSAIAFSSIGVDHAIEHVNRSMKVMGGIRGITQKPAALSRFFLIAPELARLSQEAEELAGYSEPTRAKHHDLTPAAVHQQERRINKLKTYIKDNNPLDRDGTDLLNFSTKCLIPASSAENIIRSLSAGSEAYSEFTSQRLVGKENLFDKMKKMALANWTLSGKTTQVKTRKDTIELKENRSLFGRLALAAISRPEIDMAESIGTYEFSCVSRSLFAADGSLLPCTGKSQLMRILEQFSKPESYTAAELRLRTMTIVIDGMVVVQQLAAQGAVETCGEFAKKFIKAIVEKTEHYATFHVVFDNYTVKQSLKQSTRDKRHGSLQHREYICSETTQVKTSFQNFLSGAATKHSLTLYLASALLQHHMTSEKICIVSTADGAKANRGEVSCLSSNQEEADTMLILHAVYAAASNHVVHILSTDTDVFILALRRMPHLGPLTCIINGVGEKQKLVPLKPIYDALKDARVAALPGFHAFTGCDTTGRFSGKGKKSCWKAFELARTEIVTAFGNLGTDLQPSAEDCKLLEEFVCRLYQPTMEETSVSRVRWNMFRQSQAEAERLPPTPAALHQHILRAHYQCMVWCNDIVSDVHLPDPTLYGWSNCDGRYIPVVTDLKPAPEAIVELVRCKCKAGRCTSHCSCRVTGMVCTQMCRCEADPDACDNVDPVHISNENSDEEEDDSKTVCYFPYQDDDDGFLAAGFDVQEEEVDNIVNLPPMDIDVVDV